MTDYDQQRDRPFNPYLYPTKKPSEALIMEALNQITNFENWVAPRKRKRKELDQKKFQKTVSAILCDLIHNHLTNGPPRTAITRSKQALSQTSRYRPWYFGKQLPTILDYMASIEMDFLEINLGEVGRQTTITIGDRLVKWINDYGVTEKDFCTSKEVETIILKRKKEGFWDKGGCMEYQDNDLTIRYREQLAQINNSLEKADLKFLSSSNITHPINVNNRKLFRVFNHGLFHCGGRLFGGFWQNLEKKLRKGNIYINGEVAVELDYKQTNPTLMYGMIGTSPPKGDLYTLKGFEEYREVIKKVFNAQLFRTTEMTMLPKGMTRSMLPMEFSVHDVLDAIQAKHTPLLPLFDIKDDVPPVGYRLMFQESTILLLAMERMKSLGFVSLPIHDALLVPNSRTKEAYEIMVEAFKEVSGVCCGVSIK